MNSGTKHISHHFIEMMAYVLHTCTLFKNCHGNRSTLLVSLTESADLELSPLALLHQEARRCVYKDLRKVAADRVVLSALQCLVGLAPSVAEM